MATNEQIEALTTRLLRGEEFLSYSALSCFGESPKHFIDYKFKDKKKTEAMLYGSVLHCLVLEPNEFNNRYAIAPALSKATKTGKVAHIEFMETAGDRVVISASTHTKAINTMQSIKGNWPANRLLNMIEVKEKHIEWEFMNFKFHGFIDGLKPQRLVMDLKSCADASPRKFQRDIVAMDYHLQAAMYLEGLGQDLPYYIIAADGDGGVSVHLLDDRLINAGRERYYFLMDAINKCILKEDFRSSFNFYSDRGDGVFIAEKPAYMY